MMKERIKQLAELSKTPKTMMVDGVLQSVVTIDAERFAELIVRECVGVVDDAERGGSNEIWNNAVKFIKRDLLEHFGIKE